MSDLSIAIQAVKDKISLSAGTATPEELAYLGTALDRIGGRATVYEVVAMGDVKKAELADLAATLFASIQTDTTQELTAFVAAVDAKIADMTASAKTLVDGSIKNMSDTKDAMDAHAAATLATTAAASDALASVSAAAMQQSINGSLYNLYYFSMV